MNIKELNNRKTPIIQLCVRNPNCIEGFFIPRKENAEWIVP